MKYIKLFLILPLIFFVSCDLDESPPFLDATLYQDVQSAEAARDGIYQALTGYNTQERRLFIENLYSGIMFTRKGGARVTSRDMSTLVFIKTRISHGRRFHVGRFVSSYSKSKWGNCSN